MLGVTRARKRRFCAELLGAAEAVIGFADVGSGGVLKRPWTLIPADRLRKFDFEPTGSSSAVLPVCVSNRDGEANFYIAGDERASSFHRARPEFAERYGMQSLYPQRSITVRCITLDQHFANRYETIDALDVNVEGHDLQVLEGAARLLEHGDLKLIKVEFELAAVWEGQGWLSDIDPLLRHQGYELAALDIDHARPVSVRHCFHRGEPLWGKALYVPGLSRWRATIERLRSDPAAMTRAMAKGIALYLAADIPGRALDVAALPGQAAGGGVLDQAEIAKRIGEIYRWAKPEQGVRELWSLLTRAFGVGRPVSEA